MQGKKSLIRLEHSRKIDSVFWRWPENRPTLGSGRFKEGYFMGKMGWVVRILGASLRPRNRIKLESIHTDANDRADVFFAEKPETPEWWTPERLSRIHPNRPTRMGMGRLFGYRGSGDGLHG